MGAKFNQGVPIFCILVGEGGTLQWVPIAFQSDTVTTFDRIYCIFRLVLVGFRDIMFHFAGISIILPW